MINSKINKVIDFAIEREIEAVEFYKDLQRKVSFKHKIEQLKELENMERNHIAMLNELKGKGINFCKKNENTLEDLRITDYLVDNPECDDLTYQDILIIAMKKEEAAFKLYTKLADELQSDPSAFNLFSFLAGEESKHKNYFENIYDNDILRDN